MKKLSAKRIAADGVLTALALTIFVVEAQIPLPVPVPGIKLGLSNVVTLFTMFALGPLDALIVLLARIILGSLFAGSFSSVLYSLAGGLCCYLLTLFMKNAVTRSQIWVCGALGAVVHVTAQIGVAVLLTGTPEVFCYLPVLVLSACITGTVTGLTAQFVYGRTEKLFRKEPKKPLTR